MRLRDASGYPAALADDLGVTRQSMSNHLGCQRGCGLVVAVPEGRRTRYELADTRLVHALADLHDVILVTDPDACRRGRGEGTLLMGHGHGHSAAAGHAGGRYRWRLAVTFAMVAAFLVVELVVGLWSHSLTPDLRCRPHDRRRRRPRSCTGCHPDRDPTGHHRTPNLRLLPRRSVRLEAHGARYDLVGAVVCLVGVAIIMYWPRPS